ncbi:MurR/RpiR family transcriptional regulator [Oceanibium sediminis]|uniref:MurR/RpiR family transcriptional regulator n=1 Tax=Oceanibium sediminis TaxID=2026339 RepID=UPI000DD2CADC|nr:MurR/RpiR family transcriptional regulator [Oceanibium sediminis]
MTDTFEESALADPNGTHSFRDVVESFTGRLTGSDRALVSWILNNTEGAVYLSSAELAARAEVHASTVVRLARKLGYEGFPAMREHVRKDASTVGPSTYQQKLHRIETGSNLAALVESEIAALSAVTKSVTQDQIDAAADMLVRAGVVHIVGRGSAAPLTAHLDRRLRRSGFRTEVALNLQWRDLAEHAVGLRAGDAVVIFAFQAPASLPVGYEALIDHAGRVGAKSLVIADATGPTLRPRPDLLLSVSRPDEGGMQLRTGPLLVTEALAMTLAHLDPERAIEGLEALEELRRNGPAPGDER